MSFFGSSLNLESLVFLEEGISVLEMAMPLSASWRCVSFDFGNVSVSAGVNVCAVGVVDVGEDGRILVTQVFICASTVRRNRPSGAC